jgi:chromosome partitioning protein
MHTLVIMGKSQGKEFNYTIIPTMFDKRTKAAIDAYKKLRSKYGRSVWSSVIPVDTRFRDASQAQTPPSVYAPRSRGVYAYNSLLNYVQSLEPVS